MSEKSEKLTAKQTSALAALLTAQTHAEAATQAGISEATLYRWLKLRKFRRAYLEARRRLVEGVVNQLQQLATEALAALRRNLSCGTPSAEVRTAAFIVDRCFSGLELLDLAERVAELESTLTGNTYDTPIASPPSRRIGTPSAGKRSA